MWRWKVVNAQCRTLILNNNEQVEIYDDKQVVRNDFEQVLIDYKTQLVIDCNEQSDKRYW